MRLPWFLAFAVALPATGGTAGYLALIGPAPLRFERPMPPWVLTALPPLDMGNKPEPAEPAPVAKLPGESKSKSAAGPMPPPTQSPARGSEEAASALLTLTNAPPIWPGTNAPPTAAAPSLPGTAEPLAQPVLPGPAFPLLVPQMLLPFFQSGAASTNRTGLLLNLPFVPPSPSELKSSTATYEKK